MKSSLYQNLGLEDNASLARVRDRVAQIEAGELNDIMLSKSSLELASEILTDPESKLAYDLLLEGIRREDGKLTPIRDQGRIERLQELCDRLGIYLKCVRPGQYQVVYEDPQGSAEVTKSGAYTTHFCGAELEFILTSFVTRSFDYGRTTTVFPESFGEFVFDTANVSEPPPLDSGDSGLLLYARAERIAGWTPVAFQRKRSPCAGFILPGVAAILGDSSQQMASRFQVRDRPSRINQLLKEFAKLVCEAMHDLGDRDQEGSAEELITLPAEYQTLIGGSKIPLIFD